MNGADGLDSGQHPTDVIKQMLSNFGDSAHLRREKACNALEDAMRSQHPPPFMPELQQGIRAMVDSARWEDRLGSLRAARILISSGHATDDFQDTMIVACIERLEDTEVRVRWAVGELLRSLCRSRGASAWDAVGPEVLSSIRRNFDRDAEEPSGSLPLDGKQKQTAAISTTDALTATSANAATSSADEMDDMGMGGSGAQDGQAAEVDARGYPTSTIDTGSVELDGGRQLLSTLLERSYRVESPGTGEMRHDTEGWKCLETSFRALQHAMEGCGAAFRPRLTPDIRGLIYRALLHPNRFVREACHFIVGSVCRLLDDDELIALGPQLAEKLGYGLSDNWSQVRYAASVATRAFTARLDAAGEVVKNDLLPLIVPHMCLNRYYVAEGVRLYSQETWKSVMGDQGRMWVAKCAPRVVTYYVEQSRANNHAVREAACACIAELMCKVDREAVAPHVPRLLRALVSCFKDASWPVRDAACLACGRSVTAFPEESRQVLEELYRLWFAHLWDNITSVREDSAVALANAARAYGDDAISRIVARVGEMLPMAKQQPEDSHARGGLENTTLFGVAAARQDRANDPALHTDLTMFSCGSLAPKLKRGGGCVDHGFARAKEPWEATDGAIYMVRELSAIAPREAVCFLPQLAETAQLSHFSHCLNLQETLWHALPVIAKNVGKKAFKPYLELFLEPMFRGLTCGHRLCEAAAGTCIGELRDLIGPGIFQGRLTDEQRELLHSSADIAPPGGALAGFPTMSDVENTMMPSSTAAVIS